MLDCESFAPRKKSDSSLSAGAGDVDDDDDRESSWSSAGAGLGRAAAEAAMLAGKAADRIKQRYGYAACVYNR